MSTEGAGRLRVALAECPIYGILDESLFADKFPLAIAEQWLAAGIKVLQLRAKDILAPVLLELVKALVSECNDSGALLIVNDRLDIALLAGAHGVHLGEHDAPVEDVRRVVPNLIVGGTARTAARAVQLEQQGADYVGCGSVFGSRTKPGLPVIGLAGLRAVCDAVTIPVVAIGGVGAENMDECLSGGAAGVAMISGLATAIRLEAAMHLCKRGTDEYQG